MLNMSFMLSNPHALVQLLKNAKNIPQQATELMKGKVACWKLSRPFHEHRRNLEWNESAAYTVRISVERAVNDCMRYRDSHASWDGPQIFSITERDNNILQEIRMATIAANQSNITRTQAYLECYKAYPELHWALLAHMVSRNGGWNMSDLKGGLMSDLMERSLKDNLYRMLERCNALIFQDAYPQLQLYMYSKQYGCSLFHLLPHFHVSTFMNAFWNSFWLERNSALLAVGLIINEQHYIEGRVVRQSFFQKNIFKNMTYQINHLAHVNQILFPLSKMIPSPMNERHVPSPSPGIVGLVLENFLNIEERINLGKSLYGLLFGYTDVLNQVTAYAQDTIHHGSRSEYWPELFTPDKETAVNSSIESSQLLDHEWLSVGQRIYSPTLEEVWFDMPYDPIPRYDWLKDKNVIQYISKPRRPFLIEISHNHRAALQKTALAHDIVRSLN
ncbi:hypothetical protein LPB68_07105 [Paenibacillus crassostreae]|nr:hypothetical protein LPB68_07105 [Paenibacillus crassostreae]